MSKASRYNVVIIDDHPMTVESYISLLSSKNGTEPDFHAAHDSYMAYHLLQRLEESKTPPDMALIDVNLPPYAALNIYSGIDLALLIRYKFPMCKIVIITMHKEPVWVNRIFKSISPEGFISKSDINFVTFPKAYQNIFDGECYYSESIRSSQRIYIRSNIDWDQHDSEILRLLSEGKKTVNLPSYMAMSLSTIEKRKANLKKQLILKGGSDQQLIEVAKELGLL